MNQILLTRPNSSTATLPAKPHYVRVKDTYLQMSLDPEILRDRPPLQASGKPPACIATVFAGLAPNDDGGPASVRSDADWLQRLTVNAEDRHFDPEAGALLHNTTNTSLQHRTAGWQQPRVCSPRRDRTGGTRYIQTWYTLSLRTWRGRQGEPPWPGTKQLPPLPARQGCLFRHHQSLQIISLLEITLGSISSCAMNGNKRTGSGQSMACAHPWSSLAG